MSHEADLLNELYDCKEEKTRLYRRIRYLQGRDGIDAETFLLGKELDDVRIRIIDIRASMWKGSMPAKTYSVMFSTPWNRSGRVRPHHTRSH